MTGLILKDFYALRNYLYKQLALMAIIFLGIGLVFKSCSLLPIMLMMLMVMTAMSSFNVDESAKWDGYALTLPVTREQIVGAKYLFSVGILLITGAVTTLLAILFDALTFHEGALSIAAGAGAVALVYLVILCVILPLYFKFGAEKARLLSTLAFLLPFFATFFLLPYVQIPEGSAIPWAAVCIGVIGLTVLIITLSYWISTVLYRSREF
ncbi:MAG TPA: ABC-2 transporter permease [Candidatus Merdivicinus excrementipullorum]|uniref:ABC-2 transporter permease n=1 Tax=Candidatus Merdivicinus excrementipullorum TaxID=2840867 RepID=A0A9D1FQE9_9FIRM|nr:ABC-2 transporter permease [Candidatus Merdivicinus excrementipullorum]